MEGFSELVKKAQEMQGKMQEMKTELENKEYTGKSGGEMVEVVLNGAGQMKSVSLDKSIVNPDETEILEDLVVAAFNSAKAKAEADSEKAVSGAFAHLNLPSGFKF